MIWSNENILAASSIETAGKTVAWNLCTMCAFKPYYDWLKHKPSENQSGCIAVLPLLCKTHKTVVISKDIFPCCCSSHLLFPMLSFLSLKTLAQSSAKTNRFLFMLLAGQKKYWIPFKIEREAWFRQRIILPTTFNQLDSPLNDC